MRVNIDHEERTSGWVKKTTIHAVKFHIQFSDEERHVIETTPEFTKAVVVELPENWEYPNYPPPHVTVYSLLEGPGERRFKTIADARLFAQELKEKLPLLKEEIAANAEVPDDEKSTSFEL